MSGVQKEKSIGLWGEKESSNKEKKTHTERESCQPKGKIKGEEKPDNLLRLTSKGLRKTWSEYRESQKTRKRGVIISEKGISLPSTQVREVTDQKLSLASLFV